MNLIGKMLDNRYEILEKIGNGGMATVFKAKCHVLNRFVAVKILKEIISEDRKTILEMVCKYCNPNCVSSRNCSQK